MAIREMRGRITIKLDPNVGLKRAHLPFIEYEPDQKRAATLATNFCSAVNELCRKLRSSGGTSKRIKEIVFGIDKLCREFSRCLENVNVSFIPFKNNGRCALIFVRLSSVPMNKRSFVAGIPFLFSSFEKSPDDASLSDENEFNETTEKASHHKLEPKTAAVFTKKTTSDPSSTEEKVRVEEEAAQGGSAAKSESAKASYAEVQELDQKSMRQPTEIEDGPQDKEVSGSSQGIPVQGGLENDRETALVTFAQVNQEANDRMQEIMVLSELGRSPALPEELHKLAGQSDLLYAVATEKQLSIDEQIERKAIFASAPHRDFYVMLLTKLKCTVTACESLASGMVQLKASSGYKTWLASLVKDKNVGAAMKNTPLGKLVRDSIKWASQQVPLPFVETLGTIFHALFSLKKERDRYIAAARVATFASIAEEMGGLSTVFGRISRLMIRSDRFVGKKTEFAKWQKWASELLLEPSTQPQAQACLVAEQILYCIMNPAKDGPIQDILDGKDTGASLDVVITAEVLELPTEDVKGLLPFVTDDTRHRLLSGGVSESNEAPPRNTKPVNQIRLVRGNIVGQPNTSAAQAVKRLSQPEERNNKMLEDQWSDSSVTTGSMNSSLTNTSAEILERLRLLEEDNRRLKHQLSQTSAPGKDESKGELEIGNGGFVQKYASQEDQYKGRLECLEQKFEVVDDRLDNISSEQALTREIAKRTELAVYDIHAELHAVREGRTPRRRTQVLSRSRRKRMDVPGRRAREEQLDP